MKATVPYFWFLLLAVLFLNSCQKELRFANSTSHASLVKDANNQCTLLSANGTYRLGQSLTDSNYLSVYVHVDQIGPYQIFSNEMAGFSFSGAGQFADTGLVLINISGKGIPATAGDHHFVITLDQSQCEVVVPVYDAASVVVSTNPDHFPLTNGSLWTYDDFTFEGDSVIRRITGDTTRNNRPYKNMQEFISFYPATNRQYYTRAGNIYYRFVSVSSFTSALTFSPSVFDDFIFLKENLSPGDTWTSPVYSGYNGLGPKIVDLRYQFRCTDSSATLAIHGKTFEHVYVIEMRPETADAGLPLVATGEVHTSYYARGVGLIYSRFFNGVLPHDVLKLRHWLVQ